MARQAREKSKSGNYYVELHGAELFVSDADKERFKEIAAEKFMGGKVYGIEITKTEICMTVKEPENGISMAMKSLTTVYARYFNNANNREGKLFEGRFKSEPLESKKEVDERTEGLAEKVKVKKVPVKKAAPKKQPAKKAEKPVQEKKEEQPKSAPKKNLPSWLL
ncbi:MAG: hypothetical protein IJG06_05450 [Clostridia bacterium]|nr:hypothetical protein [Clostridia bacterium]